MTAYESATVYRLHSTVEIPLEDVHEYFEDPDLPEAIADVDINRRNNTLIISAVPADESISKYTPTAQLKATVAEKRVYEEVEDADDPARRRGSQGAGLQWGDPEEEEEIPSELVEFAGFKGTLDTVLLNTELQYPMFEVLRDLAGLAEQGTLTAITAVDGELKGTRIVEGEERPASVEVVEEEPEDVSGVDWRDNDLI